MLLLWRAKPGPQGLEKERSNATDNTLFREIAATTLSSEKPVGETSPAGETARGCAGE